MSFSGLNYGDIPARIGVHIHGKFLSVGYPMLLLDKYAQSIPVPKNKGQVIKFRRPVPFDVSTEQLVEGITPAPQGLKFEDISSSLAQYGAWIAFTDVLTDTHEDPILQTITEQAGEQAALTKERILWNMMISGTNAIYSGAATTRATVVAPVTANDLRLAQRTLKVALAKPVTRMLKAGTAVATQPVAGGYIAVGHTNMEQDLRNLPGFVTREHYASGQLLHDYEIGKFEDLRFILAPHTTYFAGAGGTVPDESVLKTGGKADVYPLVIFGAEAFASTPLQGMDSAMIAVKKPVMGQSYEDPLGQRGFVSWKMWYAATRLNEAWIVRIEAAVTNL